MKKGGFVDKNGELRYGPKASEEAVESIENMLDEGEIILVVLTNKKGELGVQLFLPPSQAVLDLLEHALDGFRRAVKRELE